MAIAFLLDPTKDPADFVYDDCSKSLDQIRNVATRLCYNQDIQDDAYREASIFLNRKWDWTREERLHQGRMSPLE